MTDDVPSALPEPPVPAAPPVPPAALGPAAAAPPAALGPPVAVPPPPVAPPSTFPVDRWDRPGPAGVEVLIAAAVAGVVAATTLPVDRPGLGWLLSGAAVLGAWVAGAPGGVTRPPGGVTRPPGGGRVDALVRYAWATAALALLAVGTVRAAGWLFTLCVLGAIAAGVQALVGGRALRGLFLAAFAVPAGVARALPWAARGLHRARQGREIAGLARLMVSLGVTLVLLLVFGALFASADPAFAHLLDRVLPTVDLSDAPRWLFLFPIFAVVALTAAYFGAAPPGIDDIEGKRPSLRRLEWMLPIALLDALFAAFVGVQLAVLFGGNEYVLGVGGPNYADHARSGFWQLLTVTLLTLAVMAVAARVASRSARPDRVLVRVLLGALAVLTMVIVASALRRMALYEEAYGYTRLRLLVSGGELWLGLLFVLVLLAGVRLRARWLPQAALAAALLGLLGLAALNPDRFIADQNISRMNAGQHLSPDEQGHTIDLDYLSTLSADAVPALDRLPEEQRQCALEAIRADLQRHRDDWRSLNLGRVQARRIIGRAPVTGCSEALR